MSKLERKLHNILLRGQCKNQKELVEALDKNGIKTTQATVSRLLSKVGALKTRLPDGRVVYRLHKGISIYNEQGGLSRQVMVQQLIDRIVGNGNDYVILTKASGGRFVAEFIDDNALTSLAGTIAGGNTVLAMPLSKEQYLKAGKDLEALLKVSDCATAV